MAAVLFVLIVLAALALGFYLITAPQQAIDIQTKFYALINWRMEPISFEKEIRNTRLMGMTVIICAFLSSIYFCFNLLH